MRRLLAGLVASALLAQPLAAAPRCASQAEQEMFELAALKSELLVLAIACQRNDAYNAFIQRYRPVLLELDKNLNSHFRRLHGARWQRVADDFTTEMANARATQASRMGGEHCPRNAALFVEVMALSGAADLPAYAAGKALLPAAMASCTAPVTQEARANGRSRAATSRARTSSPKG